jgi:hypothetical protein
MTLIPSTSATVIVVPMPDAVGSVEARSKMRRFASWMSSSIRFVASCASESPASRAEAASCDATSPACAPPIPSATAKSGGRDDVVVLVAAPPASGVARDCVRRRPAVSPPPPRGRSRRRGDVAASSRCAPATRAPLTKGAVRRLQILHPGAVAAHVDPRVAGRGELVAGEHEVVLPARPTVTGCRVERRLRSVFEARAPLHDEPDRPARLLPAAEPRCCGA